MSEKKHIAILGSAGSIGTQALDVIRSQRSHFEIEVLSTFNNAEVLIAQAREFLPNAVVIGDEKKFSLVQEALSSFPVKVFAGEDALAQVVEMEDIDMVLTAMG